MLGKCCLPNLIRYLPYTIKARNVTLAIFRLETNTCISAQNTQRHYAKIIEFFLEDYHYDFFFLHIVSKWHCCIVLRMSILHVNEL